MALFSKNWKQLIVSLGEPFQIEYLDRKFGGRSKVVFKVDDAAGVVTVPGTLSVTGASTFTGQAKLPASSFRTYIGVGNAGAGHLTLASAKVGDIIVSVSDITDHTDISSGFESKVTVAGQIQQSSATDYSAKTLFILLLAQS